VLSCGRGVRLSASSAEGLKLPPAHPGSDLDHRCLHPHRPQEQCVPLCRAADCLFKLWGPSTVLPAGHSSFHGALQQPRPDQHLDPIEDRAESLSHGSWPGFFPADESEEPYREGLPLWLVQKISQLASRIRYAASRLLLVPLSAYQASDGPEERGTLDWGRTFR